MASPMTPKGRLHLRSQIPGGTRVGSSCDITRWWSCGCPHALPLAAFAAACGAFGGVPHPRNAPDFHTLPALRGAWVLPVGAPVPTRAPPHGRGGHARPMPRGLKGGGCKP